ncbi:MAG: hypothetical protein IT171_01020 [Acidobacteria bacterium]|nr:hypothetical protein [Acidobacteriota bacterium]
MNKTNLLIAVCLLTTVVLGCSMYKDSKTAEPVVAKFHEQYNNEQFAKIYAETGDLMKNASSESDIISLLSKVHEKLGDVKNATSTSWHVSAQGGQSIVNLTYDVEYEKGKGTEAFTISVRGKDAKIEGFNINSKDLILN